MTGQAGSGQPAADTFPKLLLHHAEVRPGRPAMREKSYGIWQTWTWKQVADEIHLLACGLAAKGFRRGDRIAIIGDNRPRLYWTMCAAQALGGVPVPLYQDSVAKEMAFVVDHAEVRFAMVEDQEQVDKLIEIRDGCPKLAHVFYDDPRGLRSYTQDFLSDYDSLIAAGRAFDRANPDYLVGEIGRGTGSDTAIICYTSGTTGNPKGVVLTHDNVLITARNAAEMERLTDREAFLAYLPMAWVGDNIFSYAQGYVCGFCVSCPESGATVMDDLRELGPTYFFAPPRIFENILTSVMIRMEDASALKRRLFRHFMGVARRWGIKILNKESVPPGARLVYALGQLLIYGPLKNTLGLSNIRLAYTAGEAIGPDIFDFYRALGINLKQLYGSTEASVFVAIQPDGEVFADTAGRPAKGVEIRIADNGEVLFRGPGVFKEYYKAPEATAETKTPDGWVLTGDAGLFDERGHLKIIDRAKDVGRLINGTMFAPKYIENKLKFFPDIKEAVTFGHERPSVCAFLNIDITAMGSWAERNNVAYGSYQELAAHSRVHEILKGHVESVNRDLARDPLLAGSQIHRFLVLHKELDPDDGELTRTRKVRRRIIAERYGELIEALYAGKDEVLSLVEVTFEDGRKGRLEGRLKIIDVETCPAAGQEDRARQAAA
ncbi:MAG: long-chain fatty acid--CoA ligase [Rhodospirillales bacterium]|nr:MAG: long-chain fatty acid--CoA ligase [Rhodospirillales bacterium]